MNKKRLLRRVGITASMLSVVAIAFSQASITVSQPLGFESPITVATAQTSLPELVAHEFYGHDLSGIGKDSEANVGSSMLAITPMPFVQTMLGQVTTSTLRQMMGDLTGEWPALIGGQPYTISTRYTGSDPISLNSLPGYTTSLIHVTQYAFEQLQATGMTTQYQDWQLNAGWNGVFTSRNVIGQITGTIYPNDIFIISAHIDNYPQGSVVQGADDNASGSASVLLAAKLMSQYSWNCTLRFALWTGEEEGLLGSYAYASAARAENQNIRGIINMDMLAWNSASPNGMSIHALKDLAESLQTAQLYSNVIGLYGLNLEPKILTYSGSGGYFSDHYYFWRKDYPAITAEEDSTDINPYINTLNDVRSQLNFEYYAENVKAAIAAFAHLGQCSDTRPLLPTRTPTPTYTPTPTSLPGTYNIGDYVWLDSNGNGLQDEMGTPGMDNILVGMFDISGNLLKITQTLSGRYFFRDMPPGQYVIRVALPQGYKFTIPDVLGNSSGNSDVDSNGAVTVTLSTASRYDIDAGLLVLTPTPTSTPTATQTQTATPTQPPTSTATQTQTPAPTQTPTSTATQTQTATSTQTPTSTATQTQTAAPTQTPTSTATQTPAPTQTFTPTSGPGYSLGNYVWVDANTNGIQDESSEFGKDQVLVLLFDDNENFLDFRLTSGGGYYSFSNLPSATYVLKFFAPTGFVFTTQNAFSNYVEYQDSDVNSDGVVTVTLGAANIGWIDAGLKTLFVPMKYTRFVPNTMRDAGANW